MRYEYPSELKGAETAPLNTITLPENYDDLELFFEPGGGAGGNAASDAAAAEKGDGRKSRSGARSKGGARKSDWARGVDAPFRFGALFEKVKELRDGQGAKHSREVFYAGSLWKVSVQAFVDEDPKGRRTLGLFLHRRPASEGDVDDAIGGGNRHASHTRHFRSCTKRQIKRVSGAMEWRFPALQRPLR